MGWLAERAFDLEGLRSAWCSVRDNDLADGKLGPGVERFARDETEQLARLQADLAWHAWEPDDLTEVVLETTSPGRVLHIPSVRDRVVARAVQDVLLAVVDPVLGPCSFAYRPGLGVVDAIQEVARLRDDGLPWVLRTDVDNCFPSIPVGLARRKLGALADDPDLLRVVDLLLARGYRSPRRGRRIMRGLPQGCPLSPMLANLVLVEIDEDLTAEGFSPVRYADDLVVVTATKDDAQEALRIAAASVRRLSMELGAEDTQVMSFQDGFTFLGEDFGPRYPPLLDDVRLEEPERKVLYAGPQGGRVRIQAGRIIVESADDVELVDVPSSHLRRMVLFGAVGLSAGARSWAMANGVDVVFASRRGSYLGALLGSAGSRADRVRRQLAIADAPQSVDIGRAVVDGKIRKQIILLRRFGRRESAELCRDAVSSMEQALRLLPDAQAPAELMGVEGAAAAAYFPAFGSLFPDGLAFDHRTRQPPLDLANSALSFLYTVLLAECVTALVAAGLDPSFGVLHSDDDRRPSLALDLIEDFRPLIVDSVVLTCAKRGQLSPNHGRQEEGRAGILLTRAGREAVLDAYERRMLTRTAGALPDFTGTWRRHLYRQAQRLAVSISDDTRPWTGLSWR